jgi:hypothetical protein
MSAHLRSVMSPQFQQHPGPTSWTFSPIPLVYPPHLQLRRYTFTPDDTPAMRPLSDHLDVDTSSIYRHCIVTGFWTTLLMYLVRQIIVCILYATLF